MSYQKYRCAALLAMPVLELDIHAPSRLATRVSRIPLARQQLILPTGATSRLIVQAMGEEANGASVDPRARLPRLLSQSDDSQHPLW